LPFALPCQECLPPAGRFEAIEDLSIDIGLLLAAYGARRLRWRGDIGAGGKDDFP